MTCIRVDTAELTGKAKDFQSAADAFSKAGDDILAVALSLPSYDGQLSGPARAAGYEIQRQSREVRDGLAGDAQSLNKTAQEFGAVDNQTIGEFNRSLEYLSAAPLSSTYNTVPVSDDGGDGGPILTTPFYNPNADINNTVAGTMTFLPDGACEVEDDGKPPDNWWDALASALQSFEDWVDEITGSKKARENIIGETVDFYLQYSRDTKGTGGFLINGVTVRNNSKEPIRIDVVYVNVNGTQYPAEVEGAPIFIQPGEVVNIKIHQDTPIIPYYLGVQVTLRGARPYSCNTDEEDLITLTIPSTHLPTDVVA